MRIIFGGEKTNVNVNVRMLVIVFIIFIFIFLFFAEFMLFGLDLQLALEELSEMERTRRVANLRSSTC